MSPSGRGKGVGVRVAGTCRSRYVTPQVIDVPRVCFEGLRPLIGRARLICVPVFNSFHATTVLRGLASPAHNNSSSRLSSVCMSFCVSRPDPRGPRLVVACVMP